jgi:hypothetical protein
MERRELFRVLAATTVTSASAQHAHSTRKSKAVDYKPRFFSTAEYEALDGLCETIIPADEESGGAHEAGVSMYIDTLLCTPIRERRRGGARVWQAWINSRATGSNAHLPICQTENVNRLLRRCSRTNDRRKRKPNGSPDA